MNIGLHYDSRGSVTCFKLETDDGINFALHEQATFLFSSNNWDNDLEKFIQGILKDEDVIYYQGFHPLQVNEFEEGKIGDLTLAKELQMLFRKILVFYSRSSRLTVKNEQSFEKGRDIMKKILKTDNDIIAGVSLLIGEKQWSSEATSDLESYVNRLSSLIA